MCRQAVTDFSLGAVMVGSELEDRNLRIRNTRLNTQGGHPSSFLFCGNRFFEVSGRLKLPF